MLKMNQNDTAILLFSRTAAAEAVAKPLATSPQSAQSVAAFLIQHAQQLAKNTTLPLFFFSEKQQRGVTFGERFANAFDDIFAQGYQRIIAIGNDCLTLSETDILTAAQALKTDPSVLGATTDGGAYLIGLDKSAFQKSAFQNIEWQTHLTFSKIVQFIDNQNLTTFFLSPKSDLDHISDWKKTLQSVSVILRKKLLQLLNIALASPSAQAFLPINDRFLSASIALRAPPFSI
jgi:uncharacterized protein